MAVRYTEEQLNTVDKSRLIQMVQNQQEQLETLTAEVRSLNGKMQLMMEQMVLANRNGYFSEWNFQSIMSLLEN